MADRHATVAIRRDYEDGPRSASERMSTEDLLNEIGAALFGARWFSPLADELGVNNRTIRRWVTGESEPMPGVWIDLGQAIEARVRDLLLVHAKLRAHRLGV